MTVRHNEKNVVTIVIWLVASLIILFTLAIADIAISSKKNNTLLKRYHDCMSAAMGPPDVLTPESKIKFQSITGCGLTETRDSHIEVYSSKSNLTQNWLFNTKWRISVLKLEENEYYWQVSTEKYPFKPE